jgi:hypothetical protein
VLNEECFQQQALAFNPDKHALQFNNGTKLLIEGTFVSEGTLPQGGMWAMSEWEKFDWTSSSSSFWYSSSWPSFCIGFQVLLPLPPPSLLSIIPTSLLFKHH